MKTWTRTHRHRNIDTDICTHRCTGKQTHGYIHIYTYTLERDSQGYNHSDRGAESNGRTHKTGTADTDAWGKGEQRVR